MAAYLYDKQIQVVADGQPDGDKLLSVNLILPLHSPHQGPQPAPHGPLTSENSTACLIPAHPAATSGMQLDRQHRRARAGHRPGDTTRVITQFSTHCSKSRPRVGPDDLVIRLSDRLIAERLASCTT
jgi:hypothetical protein